MANDYRLRDATYSCSHREPTYPWIDQIRRRLITEFVARTSVVKACIERARSDRDAPSPAALPELVERLARVRLFSYVGLAG